MEKFDVFVKGVDPSRVKDLEEIKSAVGEMFKLSGKKLDALFESNEGICIRRGATDKEARKYQKTLSQIGMVCICKPVKEKLELSLVPMEEFGKAEKRLCPVCNFLNKPDGEGEILRCEKCGLQFEKYDLLHQENTERVMLKERMKKKVDFRNEAQKKIQEEELKKDQQQRLEEEIEKELGLSGYSFSRLNDLTDKQKVSGAAVALLIFIAIWGGFQIIHDSAMTVDFKDPDGKDNVVVVANNIVVDQDLMENAKDLAAQTAQNITVTTPVATAEPTPELVETVPVEDDDEEENMTLPELAFDEDNLIVDELLTYQQNDIEWLAYIQKQFHAFLVAGDLLQAYRLSSLQENMQAQIDMVGQILLEYKKQGNMHLATTFTAGLEKQIIRYPVTQQIVFYAQTGKYMYLLDGDANYFDKAKVMAGDIKYKTDRFAVLGRIAKYQGQAGLLEKSNKLLQEIAREIQSNTSGITRQESMIDLARNIYDAGDAEGAVLVLMSVEKSIEGFSDTAAQDMLLEKLANSYVYIEDINYAKMLQERIQSSALKNISALRNIITALEKTDAVKAEALLSDIDFASFRAVSNALLANYFYVANKDSENVKTHAASTEKYLGLIKSEENLTATAGIGARLLARANEKIYAAEMLETAKQNVLEIKNVEAKEKLLQILIDNFAKANRSSAATELLEYVKNPGLVLKLKEKLKKTAGVLTIMSQG